MQSAELHFSEKKDVVKSFAVLSAPCCREIEVQVNAVWRTCPATQNVWHWPFMGYDEQLPVRMLRVCPANSRAPLVYTS